MVFQSGRAALASKETQQGVGARSAVQPQGERCRAHVVPGLDKPEKVARRRVARGRAGKVDKPHKLLDTRRRLADRAGVPVADGGRVGEDHPGERDILGGIVEGGPGWCAGSQDPAKHLRWEEEEWSFHGATRLGTRWFFFFKKKKVK